MTEARERAEWNRTASLLALLVNLHRDPRKRAIKPKECHPYEAKRTKKGIPLTADNIRILKAVFVKGN